MAELKNKIRELREARGMSTQQLADILGVSQRQVQLYEKGESVPKIEGLIILADLFGVSTDYLLGREA
ncbi:helix-turn-helix transcriptional regulator [Paenibacillus tundrae]|uniref:Transcriptional regulator with XRE-family HTH domain n=1 Tax=Paenibacillus tundrae TaxID=528187 RepID=A0ABT9W6G2_9BACL|nr:helix-turn-helix transcriptional regulator [Paenibacillus tundrae]MDQ0168710.1 transcriptional regulator with XRE-family HTH domain [Paenibacillus tundrae]